MGEEKYVWDDENKVKVKGGGVGSFIWNSKTKELLGRDGASWAKLSVFYAIFYTCLGSFFVGMLAIFFQIMPKDRPTYYNTAGTMATFGINPGLGFRPQIDVENSLIRFDPHVYAGPTGSDKFIHNLDNFLQHKYTNISEHYASDQIDCPDSSDRKSLFNAGKSCKFDYKTIFAKTPCAFEESSTGAKYGYSTPTPCVLIKLNKIVGWEPVFNGSDSAIKIKCEGETSADKDNLVKVTYYSPDADSSESHGSLDKKYFPFLSQKSYVAPFIFAQIDVKANTLVNVECKAYAVNIDNEDRMNKRGMTKFSVYVDGTAPKKV